MRLMLFLTFRTRFAFFPRHFFAKNSFIVLWFLSRPKIPASDDKMLQSSGKCS